MFLFVSKIDTANSLSVTHMSDTLQFVVIAREKSVTGTN